MKKDVIEFYKDAKNFNGSYHNHKEVSAWAGLVLYMLFCGLVLSADISGVYAFQATIGATVFLLAIMFCVYLHIRNQLAMKDIGGATAGAASLLLTEIIQKEDAEFPVGHYMNVAKSNDKNAQSSHFLPAELIKKRELINSKGRGFQDRTRLAIYLLLILSSALVLSVIWLRLCG